MELEPIRIPLRVAGGCFSHTGRFNGDSGSRSGRHATVGKLATARSLRKRQRRAWKQEALSE